MAWTNTRLRAIAAATVLMALPAATRAAEPTPKAAFIVDASGSMWGEIEDRGKIDILRAGLVDQLSSYENRVDLGLLAFGHRRKSDCRDVEVLQPVGPLDAATIADRLGGINPRGRTPIAVALETAAEALGGDGRRAIVLIADSGENCRGDPCAVAEALAAASLDLSIHVLAIKATKAEQQKMSCIARKGRGKLISATTPDEIEAGIATLLELVSRPPKPVVPISTEPELDLVARLGPGAPDLEDGLRWRVAQGENVVYEGSDPAPRLKLDPGSYTVVLTVDRTRLEQEIEVKAGGPTLADISLGAGVLRLKSNAGDATGLAAPRFTLYRTDAVTGRITGTVAVGREPPPSMTLPRGTYRALLEQGFARAERTISVEAGREIAEDIVLQVGRLRLAARAGDDGPVLDRAFFYVTEDDPDAEGGRLVATSAAPGPSFTLQAGLYHVRARIGEAEARVDVAVRPGEETVASVPFRIGRIALGARLAGTTELLATGVSYRIEALESPTAERIDSSRPRPAIDVAAGRYRVTARLGPANVTASQEIEVRAGMTNDVLFELDAGLVAFAATVGGKATARAARIEIRDAAGATVFKTADHSTELPLAVGDYELRLAGSPAGQPFTVIAGKRQSVEIPTE